MSKIIVEKSPPLKGSVKISGSKNSVLPIIAASLLSSESCTLEDIPDLRDVHVICEVLSSLGAKIQKDEKKRQFRSMRL